MPEFVLLHDPASYRPCTIDMHVDGVFRDYWLDHFAGHFNVIVQLALQHYGPSRSADIEACRQALLHELDLVRQDPKRHVPLDLLTLDLLRQQLLRRFNLPDPFKTLKDRENAAMLKLYPGIIAEVDAIRDPEAALLILVEGMFAGNIFDLGASATSKLFAGSSPDFNAVRDTLAGKRPWLVDQLAAFSDAYFGEAPHRKAIFFLDNAGSDAILGVIPFVRWFAARGTRVVLAANDQPALNDLTYVELNVLLEQMIPLDPVLEQLLRDGKISTCNSGGTAPLIDLRHVSNACNAEAADADIVFLEGMGRGLESNFEARFKCDSVKLCMIKEPIVAQRLGGKVFDVVFRYDKAG